MADSGVTWRQNGNTTMTVSAQSTGVRSAWVLSNRWYQNGTILIALSGEDSTFICDPIFAPSPSPVWIFSNVSSNINTVPGLRGNLSSSEMTITPRDASGEEQESAAMSFSLSGITGLAGSGHTATKSNGRWTDAENTLGASQALRYQCDLNFGFGDPAQLQLDYMIFNSTTTVTLGEGEDSVSFAVPPAYAKLTVRLSDWVWQTEDDDEVAVVRVAISPPFASFQEIASSVPRVRVFELLGQSLSYSGGSVRTKLRLVEAVVVDDEFVLATAVGANGIKAVDFELDAATSELVLTFSRFTRSVLYDPDVGILLGKNDEKSSDDNTPLIIGVAVGVPVAILVVAAVIVGALVLEWHRRKERVNQSSAINFGPNTTTYEDL